MRVGDLTPSAEHVLMTVGGILVFTILLSIYRLTLHPYAKYPGPFLAKITSWYAVYHAYVGDMHLDIERLHKQYGTFVRYGPNRLLVGSVDGFHDIYGPLKKVRKSKSYAVHGPGNLLGFTDKAVYAKKKRIFAQGFSDAAIREHEPKVREVIGVFCEKMLEDEDVGKEEVKEEKKGGAWSTAKNMTLWCNYLTTDVIVKIIFTTSWDLLLSAAKRGVVDTMTTIVRLVGVIHQSQWLWRFHLGRLFFPHLEKSSPHLRNYTIEVMMSSHAARTKDPSLKDMLGQFASAKDPENPTGLALDFTEVRINSANFIVAGSDTSSSALAGTFFYLARHPDAYTKVANEVRSTFSSAESIRAGPLLNSCVYLRAAINEAMRMSPVVVQPLWREAESGGAMIGGEHIPAGLEVGAGIFTLHHNEKVFPDPYKYDIERWIVRPGMEGDEDEKKRLKDVQRSFAPFSMGPRQCIAKNFAIMELLLTMANVFYKMDFEGVGHLGEGGPGMGMDRERVGEFQLRSYFTSHMDGPMIRFKKREGL